MDIPAPEPEPLPNVAAPFSWQGAVGFSAFAMPRWDDTTILDTWRVALASGHNTARVCAETENWPDDHWHPRFARNLSNLDRFLQVTSSVQGAQVLLMANCTLKDVATPKAEQMDWMRSVAKLASRYPNVAIEVVNEPWHGASYKRGPQWPWEWVREAIIESRRAGFRGPIGADDHLVPRQDGNYRHPLQGSINFASFHPTRTRSDGSPWDPGRGLLRAVVEQNLGLAVLSETVSYGFDPQFGGLVTSDTLRIQRYADRCFSIEGCVWFTHSLDGLRGRDYQYWVQVR